MASRFGLWITDVDGRREKLVDRWESLDYARRVGGKGNLTLTLPGDFDRPELLRRDARVEVWRGVAGGDLALDPGDCTWFIRRVQRVTDDEGKKAIVVTGPSSTEILARRIVANAAGSSQASKTLGAAKMMREIVAEQLSSGASDADRQISLDALGVPEVDVNGPTVSKSFSRRNVLTVLQELAEASIQLGEPCFFDVIETFARAGGGSQLQFRTYVGQRGSDRGRDSGDALVFSDVRGNFESPSLVDDYSEEITDVYAGGQGLEEDREVVHRGDDERGTIGPFARRERFLQATMADSTSALTDEARSGLNAGRPRLDLEGRAIDTDAVRYGRDWGLGDKIVIAAYGVERDAWVDGVQVTVSGNGQETVKPMLRDVP